MTDMGYGMARKVWELFYKDKHGVSPKPKLDKNQLREEYNHMDSDLKDVASWMNTTVDNLHIEVEMVPIEHFEKRIKEMYNTYDSYPDDAHRTNKIIDNIKSGSKPLPVYVDISDPYMDVMEGRHRMVAFWLLGMKEIPVAYVFNKSKHSEYITDDIDQLPTGGDCFKVAYRLITSRELPNHDLRLVHAITDRVKDHAWVEMGDVVFDQSNGNNYVGRKEQYYEHMGVHPADSTKFKTYTPNEVNDMAIKHMTYGPWELSHENIIHENDDEHWDTLSKTGFWGKQAAGCIFYSLDTNRYLIAHRSNMVQEPGTWGTWGGAMDNDESPTQAVSREIYEETGYNGKVDLKHIWTFQHSSGFKYHNYVAIVPNEFVPTMNWETQGYAWVSLNDLPKPIHSGLAKFLQQPEFFRTMSNL